MPPSIIPDVISEQDVPSLGPGHRAQDVARLMVERNVSAVVVADDEGRLVGIVTERDLSRRVVATDTLSSTVTAADVMTPEPQVIGPEDSPTQALAIMSRYGIRHLPVVSEGRVLALLSIRDLQLSMSQRVVSI